MNIFSATINNLKSNEKWTKSFISIDPLFWHKNNSVRYHEQLNWSACIPLWSKRSWDNSSFYLLKSHESSTFGNTRQKYFEIKVMYNLKVLTVATKVSSSQAFQMLFGETDVFGLKRSNLRLFVGPWILA